MSCFMKLTLFRSLIMPFYMTLTLFGCVIISCFMMMTLFRSLIVSFYVKLVWLGCVSMLCSLKLISLTFATLSLSLSEIFGCEIDHM